VGHWPCIRVDPTGKPGISYHDYINGHLRYAEKNPTWATYVIDPADGRGAYSSFAFRQNGSLYFSYYDDINQHLRFAENIPGSGWVSSIVDPADGTGPYSSIALDCNDNVRISYYDGVMDDLKFAYNGVLASPCVLAVEDPPGGDRPWLGLAPNPARDHVSVDFALVRSGNVMLAAYDVAGRQLAQLTAGRFDAGPHHATWNFTDSHGRPIPAGYYLIRLRTEDQTMTRGGIRVK
jgi:hypothetical protein